MKIKNQIWKCKMKEAIIQINNGNENEESDNDKTKDQTARWKWQKEYKEVGCNRQTLGNYWLWKDDGGMRDRWEDQEKQETLVKV